MINSKQPRKQRGVRVRAPLHIRQKYLRARLNPSLAKKYNRRSFQVKRGDTVKILRGDFKGNEGKVAKVDLKAEAIHVDGVTIHKADGSEVPRPIHPSNVIITKLELKDKLRTRKLKEA